MTLFGGFPARPDVMLAPGVEGGYCVFGFEEATDHE